MHFCQGERTAGARQSNLKRRMKFSIPLFVGFASPRCTVHDFGLATAFGDNPLKLEADFSANASKPAQIRSEYLHVPAEIFRQKRAEILREFLTTRHIYATDQYRRDREARARANIEAEIALLDAGDLSALERQSEAPS